MKKITTLSLLLAASMIQSVDETTLLLDAMIQSVDQITLKALKFAGIYLSYTLAREAFIGPVGSDQIDSAISIINMPMILMAANIGPEMPTAMRKTASVLAAIGIGVQIAYGVKKYRDKSIRQEGFKVSLDQIYTSDKKAGLRPINDDAQCPICLESVKELRQAGTTIVQTQCCSNILCEQDLKQYVDSWNKGIASLDNGTGDLVLKCSQCRAHAFTVAKVDASK